jgi:hypothetical protein
MTTETAKPARRWPRYRLDFPLRLIVHGPAKTTVIVGRGNELNEGGMALTAGVELKLGDQTEIEFIPPYAGSPIRVRGVVRNRKGYRYGWSSLRRMTGNRNRFSGGGPCWAC